MVMNAKASEYFRQLYRYEEIIASNTEQIEKLRLQAQKITTSIFGSRVQSSGSNHPMAEALDQIADLEKEIAADSARLITLAKEARRVIEAMPNRDYRLLLEKHYLSGKNFSEIADEMNYSLSYVKAMHSKALDEVTVPEQRIQREIG